MNKIGRSVLELLNFILIKIQIIIFAKSPIRDVSTYGLLRCVALFKAIENEQIIWLAKELDWA